MTYAAAILVFLQVAQATPLAESPVAAADGPRVFGLTVAEWSILVGGVLSVLETYRRKRRESRKVDAMIEAIEEVSEQSPETAQLAKRLVRDKATKFGVQVSSFLDLGLDEDVKKQTRKYDRKKLEEDKPDGETPPIPED